MLSQIRDDSHKQTHFSKNFKMLVAHKIMLVTHKVMFVTHKLMLVTHKIMLVTHLNIGNLPLKKGSPFPFMRDTYPLIEKGAGNKCVLQFSLASSEISKKPIQVNKAATNNNFESN